MDQTIGTWLVGLILVLIQGALTTVLGLVIKVYWDKRNKDRQLLEEAKERARIESENKRCMAVKDSIHQELIPVTEDLDSMKKAMQKDIRRSLRQDGKAYVDRGWATHQEKTEFDELYWAYHNLGRNGVVDALHEQIMKLPEDSERRQ